MTTHDRDYYRCLDDIDLVRLARDSGHELAIVLGERLAMLSGFEAEIAHQRARVIYWQRKAADATLRAADADAALQAARDPGDD
jgi:hypothetical protein